MSARDSRPHPRGSGTRPPLGPRLEAMVRFALPDRPVIDVGADHAYAAIALAQTGRHPRVLAIDISASALDAARRHAREYGVEDVIELCRGQGLEEVPAGIGGTVLVGGMGGLRILDMLGTGGAGGAGGAEGEAGASDRWVGVERLVLQPQTAAERLRRGLVGMGWVILDEVVCPEDGRFYWVIVAERDDSPRIAGNPDVISPADYGDLDWRLGAYPRRRGDPDLRPYLVLEEQRFAACLGQMSPGEGAPHHQWGAPIGDLATPTRKQELERALDRIREERRRLEVGAARPGTPAPSPD